MRTLVISLFIMLAGTGTIPFCGSIVDASQSDRRKVVERFEVNPEAFEKDLSTNQRYLSNIAYYDVKGRVVERFDIVNDSSGASYSRHVFDHDRLGRRTAHLAYQSEKGLPGQYFSTVRTGNSVSIVPRLPENISEVTVNSYDGRGNLLETRKSGPDGLLIQKVTMVYDSYGNQIRYLNLLGDGELYCESTTTVSGNGRKLEQVYGNCPMNGANGLVKILSQKDEKGRSILEEQFHRSLSSQGPKPLFVLTSRGIRSYEGDLTHLDWTIWNNKGEPDKRLLVTHKNDDEISLKEFTPDGTDEGKIRWKQLFEQTRDHIYDTRGVLIRETTKQKPGQEKVFRLISVTEMRTTYL